MRLAALAVAVACCGATEAAADPAADALVSELAAARRALRSVDATFTQDKEMPLFAETVRSRGRLRVLAPDRLRWDTESPDASSFVYARGDVAFRGPDGRARALPPTALAGAVLGDLAAFLAGDPSSLAHRYRLSVAPASADAPPDAATLVAVPRDDATRRQVREVRVELAKDRRVLLGLVLVEAGGDRTVVRFTRFRLDTDVPASAFRL